MNIKFSLALGFVLASLSVSGWAQQNGAYKVKHTPPEKAPKKSVPMPMGKTGASGTASTTNAKDLNSIEHQTMKSSTPSRAVGAKPAGKGAGLKSAPVKDKANPPIYFNGNPGGKNPGTVNQTSNPYRGRLRQKHSGSH
jgi:hypothetical protein